MEALDRFRPGTNVHATIIGQRFWAWHWGLHQADSTTLLGTATERARLREQQSAEYEAALEEDRRREAPGRAPYLTQVAENQTLSIPHAENEPAALAAEGELDPPPATTTTLAVGEKLLHHHRM